MREAQDENVVKLETLSGVHGQELYGVVGVLLEIDLAAGLKHHMIPVSWVELIDDDTVRLSLTKDAAKAAWRTKH